MKESIFLFNSFGSLKQFSLNLVWFYTKIEISHFVCFLLSLIIFKGIVFFFLSRYSGFLIKMLLIKRENLIFVLKITGKHLENYQFLL